MEKLYAQIAQETYERFCDEAQNQEFSEEEFIAALKTLKSWVDFEAKEWGIK